MRPLPLAPVILAIAAVLPCLQPAQAAPVFRSRDIDVGTGPARVAIDPVTKRLFVANQGSGQFGTGFSVGVVEPTGEVKQLAVPAAPTFVAVSAAYRKAIFALPACSCAAVVDADSLQVRTVATGYAPIQALTVDGRGMAYILSQGFNGGTSETPGAMALPGAQRGPPASLTTLDLATLQTRNFDITNVGPRFMVADEKAGRLYLFGTNYLRTYESLPGYVFRFDMATNQLDTNLMPVGRLPKAAVLSANGRELYVGGVIDYARPPRYEAGVGFGVRAAILVVDTETLGVKRTIDLPDPPNVVSYAPTFMGDLRLDPSSGRVYAINSHSLVFTDSATLSVVNPQTGAVASTPLEANPGAIGLDSKSGSLLVSLPRLGQAAVFDLAGQRIDTVSIGRAPTAHESFGISSITIDPDSGTAYATNGVAGTISALQLPQDASAGLINLTDLWFKPSDPGWGVYVEQQGTSMFAALFNQDAAGNPTWLVMSNGARQPDGSFAGDLFAARGPVAQAPSNVSAVGTMRFEPADDGGAILTYASGGVAHRESLERFQFAQSVPACEWTAASAAKSAGTKPNYTSLWWNPEEPGWGLAVSHQGATTFATIFTYDALNRPSWAVMSNGAAKSAGAFGGTLYRSFKQRVDEVGAMSLAFSDANSGTLTYKLDGVETSKRIVREQFSGLVSACSR